MRSLVVVAVAGALLVPGCLGGAGDQAEPNVNPEPPAPVDPWDGATELLLAQGDRPWFPVQARPFEAVVLALQPMFNPCVFQERTAEEHVYFTNLNITPPGEHQHVPNGTSHLSVALDWQTTDYAGDVLYLAYELGGMQWFATSDGIASGTPADIPLPTNAWEEGPEARQELWLCVQGADRDLPPESNTPPYLGDIAYSISVVRGADLLTAPAEPLGAR